MDLPNSLRNMQESNRFLHHNIVAKFCCGVAVAV